MYKKWIIFIAAVASISLVAVVVRNVDFSSNVISLDFSLDDGYRSDVIGDTTVRLANVSDYTISPGVLVIHNRSFSMNFLGDYIPDEYELLSEVGDPSVVLTSLRDLPGVYDVLEVSLLESGVDQTFNFFVKNSDALVSYMAMIVQTNDGVVWLNSFPLYDENEEQQWGNIFAEVLDMGTEQNSPIGSGFAGGQPDPSRGVKNVDNGVSTTDVVQHHSQFYDDPAVSSSVIRVDLNS